MGNRTEKVANVERALRQVYRTASMESRPMPGSAWDSATMTRIRRAASRNEVPDFFSVFSTFVWRLAPAAAVLIVVLAAWMVQLDMTSEIETAALMDPIGFDFINKLGIL